MTQQLSCRMCNTSNRATAKFCAKCGAPLTQLQPGRVMNGKYTIVRELGRGGMGAVYLAQQTLANTHRQVVVKEMLDYYDPNDPDSADRARQRFETEASTLVTLNIAGVPQIFDYFTEGGRNYIVMQYVEGQNLEEGLTHTKKHTLIQGRPYSVDQVRAWGAQICRVLEVLAGKGIVHMDIKPANLILDQGGNIWLVDFGTAKAQRTVQSTGAVGMQKSSVYGTAGYAPPEQYTGQAEPRSDVYALAATLYHLVTNDDPRDHPFNFPGLGSLPADLCQALTVALNQNLTQRADAAQLRASLSTVTPNSVAFRWQDGSISLTPESLVTLVDSHWDEARSYFHNGAWEQWFRSQHRNDLLSLMQQVRTAHPQQDVALDVFVRRLAPNFPPARLALSSTTLDFGSVPWSQQRSLKLEIVNTGSGCLHGDIRNLPTWLKATPEQFAVRSRVQIEFTTIATAIPPSNQIYTGQLRVDGGGGGHQIVTARVETPEPILALSPNTLSFVEGSEPRPIHQKITIHNKGGSAFAAKLTTTAAWLTLSPAMVNCPPGKQAEISVTANTSALSIGRHDAQINVSATAGNWQKTIPLTAKVARPFFTLLRRRWGPALDWAVIGSGLSLGWAYLITLNPQPWWTSPMQEAWYYAYYSFLNPLQFRLELLWNRMPTAYTWDWSLLPIALVSGWIGVLGSRKGRHWSKLLNLGFIFGGFALPWFYAFKEALAGNLLLLIILSLPFVDARFTALPLFWFLSAACGGLLWLLLHLQKPAKYSAGAGLFGLLYLIGAGVLLYRWLN